MDKALYSVPGDLIGEHVEVRADSKLVRISHRGRLVKVHPRAAVGGRETDPTDLPADKTVYAMRDLDALHRLAAGHGPPIGAYASALLDHPLPWTKMRQVYALLGLVKRWGPGQVNDACARALQAEAVNVGLIGRMLERAEAEATTTTTATTAPSNAPGRDTTTPSGRLVFHVFAALAELEAALIRERTTAGLQAARARGRSGGRPRAMTPDKLAVARQLYDSGNHTLAAIAKTIEVSRSTLYRHLAAGA